jgi:hypothetical protein
MGATLQEVDDFQDRRFATSSFPQSFLEATVITRSVLNQADKTRGLITKILLEGIAGF